VLQDRKANTHETGNLVARDSGGGMVQDFMLWLNLADLPMEVANQATSHLLSRVISLNTPVHTP
jgi:hypothetical protein